MGLRVHKHSDVFHSYCLRFLGLFTGRLGLYSTAVYCVITSSIAFLVRNETMSHLNLSRGFVFWFSRKKSKGNKKANFSWLCHPFKTNNNHNKHQFKN